MSPPLSPGTNSGAQRRQESPSNDATPGSDVYYLSKECHFIPSLVGSKRRVLLVDDHRFFLQALHLLLEHQLGLTVAAEARTGAEALAHVERGDFDLILMDVHLPDANGIEISRRILEHRKDAKIIMLTADADPLQIDKALRTGVLGYVLKINTTEELQHAIIAVSAETRYLSPEANAALLAGYRSLRNPPPTSSKPLSAREREVISLLANGQRTSQIATTLGVGPKSIETYRHRAMQKLGLFSITELTRYVCTLQPITE